MDKSSKLAIVSLCLTIIAVISIVIGIKLYNASFRPTGKMIMSCNNGVYQYDLQQQKMSRIPIPKIDNPVTYLDYNTDKTKFLMLCTDYGDQTDHIVINEVDSKTGDIQELHDFDCNSIGNYRVKYTPDKNEISYCVDNKLWIYNLDSQKATATLDSYGDYNWDSSGKHLFYQDDLNSISEYDYISGTSRRILDGSNPVISSDGRYIAYLSKRYHLVVYDFVLQKAVCSTKLDAGYNVAHYRFSADNKYVVLGFSYTGIASSSCYKNVFIKIKSGHKKTFLNSFSKYSTLIFDVK